MKVVEKGSDRTAEVHLRADGVIEELQEFGEYVDADGAICSYVAMEEGSVIKLEAKFSGTTMAITYDAVVDGVLRASSIFHGKHVATQKNKKLTHDKFLCHKEDATLYTSMKVAPAIGMKTSKQDGPENVGTLEFRLYVLRELGEEHSIDKVLRYDNQKDFAGADPEESVVTYSAIEPDLKMVFEEDSLAISEGSAIIKRLDRLRPGNAPWAIFRFKYRTREAIEAQEFPVTFDGKKMKGETKVIDLGPLPHLSVGDKPTKPKDKDDPAAPSPVPGTPNKDRRGASASTSVTPAKTLGGTVPATPAIEQQDLQESARLTSPVPQFAVNNGNLDSRDAETNESEKKQSESASTEATTPRGEFKKPRKARMTKKAIAEQDKKKKATARVDELSTKSPQPNVDTNTVIAEQITAPNTARPRAQENEKIMTGAPENSVETLTETRRFEMPASATSGSTNKRAADKHDELTPEPKRHQTTEFATPTRTTAPPSTIPPTKKPLTLAETRKQLEKARWQREQLAKKQEQLSLSLEPYKQRMEEELVRMTEELEAEKRLLFEEARAYQDDQAMLEDFKKRGAGN